MNVNLILSIVIASATVLYTVINYFMLSESKKTRELKITPLILIFLKSSESRKVYVLHIKNIGEGVAKNVRVNLNEEYYQYSNPDSPLSELGIFKNGFNIFPPGYELKYHIGNIVELNQKNFDGEINLEVTYENIKGRKFKNQYLLKFNQMFGQNYSKPPDSFAGQTPYYLNEISKTLMEIQEKLLGDTSPPPLEPQQTGQEPF